jgi:hypothetical protein
MSWRWRRPSRRCWRCARGLGWCRWGWSRSTAACWRATPRRGRRAATPRSARRWNGCWPRRPRRTSTRMRGSAGRAGTSCRPSWSMPGRSGSAAPLRGAVGACAGRRRSRLSGQAGLASRLGGRARAPTGGSQTDPTRSLRAPHAEDQHDRRGLLSAEARVAVGRCGRVRQSAVPRSSPARERGRSARF